MLDEHGVCLIQRTVTRAFPEASVLCEISLNHNINHYSDIVILQGSRLTSKTFPSFHHNTDTFILLPFILFNIYTSYRVRINHQAAAITLEHRHFHQRIFLQVCVHKVVVMNEGSELFRLTSFLLILMVFVILIANFTQSKMSLCF